MPDTPSSEVIKKAQVGDTSAVTTIYRHFNLRVFRYLYYRVNDQHTAEDLTSEVFLHMIKALPNYRLQGIPFQAWLYRIARNLVIDHSRKNGRYTQVQLPENLVAVSPDPLHAAEHQLTVESLRVALAKLNQEQREVIILRFIAGLPINETAIVIGKSINAVKGLQRRALLKLREILNDVEVIHVINR